MVVVLVAVVAVSESRKVSGLYNSSSLFFFFNCVDS